MSATTDARPLPVRRKCTYSAITIVVFLGIVETVARVMVDPRSALVHQEHALLNSDGGLPALNDLMEFDAELFWKLKKELHDVRIHGFNGAFEIDFRVTIQNHLRSNATPLPEDSFRILALGDSCTFGVGVNDDQTWPAQLQQLIADRGYSVQVVNAGVPGYTSFQGKRFLQESGLAMRPQLVVCCFGVNDGDTWASRSDFETARLIRLSRLQSQLVRSRLFLGLKRAVQRTPPIAEESADSRRRLSPSEFHSTLAGIHELCEQNNMGLMLLVWPSAQQIARGCEQLVLYQELTPQFAESAGVPVVNLVPTFLDENRNLFVDGIHANEAGCRVVARALSHQVIRVIESSRERNGAQIKHQTRYQDLTDH